MSNTGSTSDFTLKNGAPWAKKGHEIAWEQFRLPWETPAPRADSAKIPPLTISNVGNRARFSGPDFAITFDKHFGLITSYVYKGNLLLERGPVPDFWRAMTDNDIGAWRVIQPGVEKRASQDLMMWREMGTSCGSSGSADPKDRRQILQAHRAWRAGRRRRHVHTDVYDPRERRRDR